MTSLIWTRPARADLAMIDEHYGAVAPEYANCTGRTALAAARFLAEYPAAGPLMDDVGTRKLRVRGTDYILLYRIVATGVEILRVRHDREDWR